MTKMILFLELLFIPTKKRVKMLKKQKKQIEKSEECFKTDRKQLERQFTL